MKEPTATRKLTILLIFLFSVSGFLQAQNTISGTVSDSISGVPLSDVNIVLKDSYLGAVSDRSGNFNLNTEQAYPVRLIFSFVGYKTKEIEVSSPDQNISIALERSYFSSNDIIITAQRRKEQLQSVPASINVLDRKFLEATPNVNFLADLVMYTPGMAGNFFGGVQIYTIRGIGSSSYGVGQEASVGIFQDEVYVGRVTAPFTLFDLERVEVIKRPQNTLFGRNATAGAISVTTVKPSKSFGGFVEFGFGNEGQKKAGYGVDLPVNDALSFRVAGNYNYRDGVRRISNQDDQQLSKIDLIQNRLSMRYQPGNRFNLDFSVEQQYLDNGGWDGVSILTDLGGVSDPFERNVILDGPMDNSVENYLGRLELKQVLNENTYFKSITSFLNAGAPFVVDGDALPLDIFEFYLDITQNNFTQDLRIISQSKKLNWSLGVNYSWEKNEDEISLAYNEIMVVGGTPIEENGLGFTHPAFMVCDNTSDMLLGTCNPKLFEDSYDIATNNSYALFGDIGFNLSPNWNATFGLRITSDQKQFVTNLPLGDGVTQQIFGDNLLGPNTGDGEKSSKRIFFGLQPSLSVDYKPGMNSLLFFRYGRGYKAGGFNNISAKSFDQENSDAFEIGLKSSSSNGKFRFNSSLYYSYFRDLQDQTIGDVAGLLVVGNAGGAESMGVEIETGYNFSEALSLSATTSLGKFRYQDYVVGEDDYADNVLPRSPEQTFSLIGAYNQPLGKELILSARFDYTYQSRIYFSRENLDALSQDAYGLVNTQIGLSGLLKGGLDLSLFAYNLLDQNYIVQAEDPFELGPNILRGVPRLIGLNARINFGKR